MDLKQFGPPLMRGSANVWKSGEPVRGKLYLLERALVHQPQGFHMRADTVIIEILDIKEIVFKNFFGIIPNGLVITLKDEKNYTLVINRRKRWLHAINTQCETLKNDVNAM